jgi:hypothetical protein
MIRRYRLNFAELTEAERQVVEQMRVLGKQDPTFLWLPIVLADRMAIMVERGAKYNGHGSTVMEQIYFVNDQSAYHKVVDPINRLRNICPRSTQVLSDKDLHQLPEDAANYLDMWKCCRLAWQSNSNQA